MKELDFTRRDFLFQLSGAAGAAWLAANWPAIAAAQEHAHRAAQATVPPKLEFFTPEQAVEVEAMAAQIIPTDDTPGAREARVIYFMDRALMTFDQDKKEPYTKGLELLAAKTKELFPGAAKFSALGPEQQIAVLKAIEKEPFFGLVRAHTVMGFLSDPSRGGNAGKAGWQVMGFEDRFVWKPPFGHYDAEWAEEQAKKAGE